MKLFTGLGTALITPFDSTGKVDYDALAFLLKEQAGHVDFLVPCGTTGESPTLSDEEMHQIIWTANNIPDRKMPVLAGTGSNDTKKAVYFTEIAKASGADGVLVVSPYYNKPMEKGLRDYYEQVAGVGLPVVLYDIPGRTAKGVPTELITALAKEEVICGVKWASGDHSQLMRLVNETPDNFTVLSGDDIFTLGLMAYGGDGAISVVSNIVPEKMKNMLQGFNAGEFDYAKRLHYAFLPLMRAMTVETNPIPVKTAFHWIYSKFPKSSFGERPYFRSPMSEMEESSLAVLKQVVSKYFI